MRFHLRPTMLGGLAAATLCLAPMMTNDAAAQSFSFSFGSRGTTPYYYNGYGGGPYAPGHYGYTGYGQRSYGYGSSGLYSYPSHSRYGRSGTSYDLYYRGWPSQGRTYGHGHSRHYSPYGYGGSQSRYGYTWGF